MDQELSGDVRLLQPPALVVKAAEYAIRKRTVPDVRKTDLVFDSLAHPDLLRGGPRVLVFSCDAFDVILTVTPEARGNRVTGTVLGDTDALVVAIRRPTRATIAVPATPDGLLAPTLVPRGTASVYARALSDGRIWQSEWLTM
jgi:hypothetical protein